MDKTTNYNLNKPDPRDFLDVENINENSEIIDQALHTITTEALPKSGGALTGSVTANWADRTDNDIKNIQFQNASGAPVAASWLRTRD